jgi:hypothetical protein
MKPGTGVISTEPSEMIRDFDEDSNINEEDCGESSSESHHRHRLAVTDINYRAERPESADRIPWGQVNIVNPPTYEALPLAKTKNATSTMSQNWRKGLA